MQEAVQRSDFDKFVAPTYSPAQLIPQRGQGSLVWDQNGRRYVDLAGGVAVTGLGHAHPELVATLREQSESLWHVGNVFTNEPVLALAKQLTESTFADRAFFANSGAEANEAALKLARKVAHDTGDAQRGKTEIVAFQQSFHGRTLFTVSVGGQSKYSEPFGPLPPGIKHLPFNDTQAALDGITEQTCAVIVELVQGESGVRPASAEFVDALRVRCSAVNALLIFDEVQTGVGRTGELFAYLGYGIEPDILTTAKALGNGFPIGAMLTSQALAEHLTAGSHGSTFGGNPLAAAVADKVLEIVRRPETLAGVKERHAICMQRLNEINARTSVFADIRGRGLLIGAELGQQFKGRSGKLVEHAYAAGVFTLMAGPDVLRLAPSLVIPLDVLNEGMDAMERAVVQFAATPE
ncbi:bifunctional N-succinyldiaminopimelate-aminotransferase/ acetylornithine transaminase protein [Caballeronia arvi]|uniref:Acetylornithine aminotransferase n=1 Tax=Caballeronia arvi TaxID=1777135 RepID=A0A158J6C8_9BURK|nr:acetylornithine/succinylornithine family transaminase [Caballeronia arvi]SAL63871.1 bifunctional N-succinyldiaminopimelate-aminotransferase/ acetylornithine transaminase protein [Caballeronia arvi]